MNDPTPTLSPEHVIQTYQRAKDRRRMWESHWDDQNKRKSNNHTGIVSRAMLWRKRKGSA